MNVITQEHDLPDDVLQLAHVARPVIARQTLHRLRGEPRPGALVTEGIGIEELADENGNLVRAIPQSGHADVHDAEPIVEVFPEFAPLDVGPQVAVSTTVSQTARTRMDGGPKRPAFAGPKTRESECLRRIPQRL